MNINNSLLSNRYYKYLEYTLGFCRLWIESLSQRVMRLSLSRLIRTFGTLLLASALTLPLASHGAPTKEVWLRVDTQDATLTVMKGDKPLEIFSNIAIGRYGKTYFKKKGDHRTPLGRFTIAWIPAKSQYHRFLGLNYPDLERADRALVDKEITEAQWQAIRRATQANKRPPQDTPLGGFIGIHGTGDGDLKIHGQYNWTSGCIALTNEQIDRLASWVRVGTPVEIR
jgi:murein L,D-transpeptidase YafK